jgi:hypothetical protein
MARTYEQQLDAVDAAIAIIEAGGVADYEIAAGGDRQKFSKLNIAELYAERRRLTPLAARETAGVKGGRVRVAAPRSA